MKAFIEFIKKNPTNSQLFPKNTEEEYQRFFNQEDEKRELFPAANVAELYQESIENKYTVIKWANPKYRLVGFYIKELDIICATELSSFIKLVEKNQIA